MLSSKQKAFLWAGGVAGLILLAVGVFALFYVPRIIEDQVVKQDVIGTETDSNGTRVYNDMTRKWQHPPYEMILHVYMYSVQNEAAYLAGNEKLRLSQKGPYAFIEDQEKVLVEFNEDESRVFYRNRHRYFFSQEHSCSDCLLTDIVTVPNVIFQKLVDIAETNNWAKIGIERVLPLIGRETPFVTISVGQALFDGYDDPILNKLCSGLTAWICKLIKIPAKIGFFYGQNNTDDGLYEVGTGKNGPSDLGKMYTFNNASSLPDAFWESPYARAINGTDGQLFPPLLKKSVQLPLFASQACRSVKMAYMDDSEYQGISSWRYSTPSSMYDPADPDNHIFCHEKTLKYFDDEKVQLPGCLPAGMLDLSACQPGEPRVYLSQAHFYKSPKEVWSAIDGLDEPSDDRDVTYVDIEPTSGVPIYAKRVMQVNVGMKKGNLNVLANLPSNLIVPVFWVNETASVDVETRNQLVNELQAAKHYAFIGGISSLTIGALLAIGVILAVLLELALGNRDEESQPLVEHSSDNSQEEPNSESIYAPQD